MQNVDPTAATTVQAIPGSEFAAVIPTFCEQGNLRELVQRIEACRAGVRWEVVFVDDNSPDGTSDLARALSQTDSRIRCVQRIGRRGRRVGSVTRRNDPPCDPTESHHTESRTQGSDERLLRHAPRCVHGESRPAVRDRIQDPSRYLRILADPAAVRRSAVHVPHQAGGREQARQPGGLELPDVAARQARRAHPLAPSVRSQMSEWRPISSSSERCGSWQPLPACWWAWSGITPSP